MRHNKNITSKATISKGYRLRPSTHKLIKRIQRSLNATQDRIISLAIKLFQKEAGISTKSKINK